MAHPWTEQELTFFRNVLANESGVVLTPFGIRAFVTSGHESTVMSRLLGATSGTIHRANNPRVVSLVGRIGKPTRALVCNGCRDIEASIAGVLVIDLDEEAGALCGACIRRLHLEGSMTGEKAAVDASRLRKPQFLHARIALRGGQEGGLLQFEDARLSLWLIGVSVLRCSPPMVD